GESRRHPPGSVENVPKVRAPAVLLLRQVETSEAVREIMVDLGARSYTVQIGPGLLDTAGAACARLRLGRRAAVVTQPAGQPLATRVTTSLRSAGFEPAVFVVPEGEESKSLREAERLWDGFIAHGLDRHSPVVAVGGGVVGDLAGFAGSAYMRGLPV